MPAACALRPRAPPFIDPAGYSQHRPEATLLYRLVEQHYPVFRELRARDGRSLPGHVQEEFGAYLKCGRLQEGFLRVRCGSCQAEKLVAFSCKKRGFCPSCGGRRMAETAALLADEVLPERPLRQWVLLLPFALRFLLATDSDALTLVLRTVYRAISASPYIHCKKCRSVDAAQHENWQFSRGRAIIMSHRKRISDHAALAPAILGTDTSAADVEHICDQRVFHAQGRRSSIGPVSTRPDMRLGTALQIGFLKMCGRPLDKLQRVPIAVLEYLSSQVGGTAPDIATLRAIYVNRPRTLFQHQQFALDMLGMTRFEITADAPRVLSMLIDVVRGGIDGDKLLAEIRVILYERRYVIPGPRTVGELAKRARGTVEHEIGRAIEQMIPPEMRAQWVEKLFSVREDGMTVLEFLQEPPGSLRTRSIVRESEKVRTLREMKIPDLTALTGAERYWQMYAMRMRHQRRSRFAQRNEPRRSIELVGFLRHSLAEHAIGRRPARVARRRTCATSAKYRGPSDNLVRDAACCG
jgi:hypothetical protein